MLIEGNQTSLSGAETVHRQHTNLTWSENAIDIRARGSDKPVSTTTRFNLPRPGRGLADAHAEPGRAWMLVGATGRRGVAPFGAVYSTRRCLPILTAFTTRRATSPRMTRSRNIWSVTTTRAA